ncbi:thermonuclease family protein [Sneathiella marina]|uniref:Thermonuclease family protein n=1 Tax=Sneathiella marina TaxID=2950108 RepID=A0ABY4W1J3_9PROT|nr:thermonuclease family protein [Sneathiella marina]USG60721.1 thermonuclease family protein [Sneathiella marina]
MNKYGLVAVSSLTVWLATSVAANEVMTFRISSIIDGRLITEDGKAISLYGLQFPDPSENPAGAKQAADQLISRVLTKQVTLDLSLFEQTGSSVNRYGDYHGQVLDISGNWIQQDLIEKGFAWWSGAAKYPRQLRLSLIAAERSAEKASFGVWQTFKTINANMLTVVPKYADFVIAEGRVHSVYSSAKMTYINFGENWKSDFTAAISSINKRNFESQGWKLSALVHKLVRIRGSVRWYNGPFMELSFPEQLEIRSPPSN